MFFIYLSAICLFLLDKCLVLILSCSHRIICSFGVWFLNNCTFLCVWLFLLVCTPLCAVLEEVRKGHWVPWNWSCRKLWASMWVLGPEFSTFKDCPVTPNSWTISPVSSALSKYDFNENSPSEKRHFLIYFQSPFLQNCHSLNEMCGMWLWF